MLAETMGIVWLVPSCGASETSSLLDTPEREGTRKTSE
jgi:hypothetical protein